MRFNRPFLASFLINSAVLSLVLGAAGCVDLWFESSSFLPALTIMGSLPGILIGAGFMAFIFNQLVLLRFFGVLLVGAAIVMWFGDVYSLSEQFHAPPDAMIFNLVLIGAAFVSYRLCRYDWVVGAGAVIYGLVLGVAALTSIWAYQPALSVASNIFELSILAVMMVIVPLAMVAAYGIAGYDVKGKLLDNWASIVLIHVITVSLWVYLSHSQIREVYRQGEMSITQMGESIDRSINYYREAAQRLQDRVINMPAEQIQSVARAESLRLWTDYPLIDSVTLLQDDQSPWHTRSRSNESYTHVTDESFARWVDELDTNIRFAADLNTESPKAVLGLRLVDEPEAVSLLVHLDLHQTIDALPDSYFDVFSKVIRIGENTYIGVGAGSENAEALINSSSAVIQSEYVLPTGNPLAIHAVLTEPNVLLNPVRVHQIVLLIGFIFSIVLIYTFITNARLRRQRSELKQLATHDNVTSLYRRDVLEQQIQQYIDSNRLEGYVLFVDLDGFKPINDSMGLEIGNQVLNVIANRLMALADSHVWVSRFSSDEFIIFVEVSSNFDLDAYCHRVLKSIRPKILVDEFSLYLTASVGVYQLDDEATKAEQAIQRADVAMSSAKESGGNTYRIFTNEMAKHYQRALTIRNELQDALDEDALEVFYQPIVNAVTGVTESVEALVRWPQPDGSYIPPSLFIPIAERTGQIFQLSQFVLKRALRDTVALSEQYGLNLSINLSFQQFYQFDIFREIDCVISEAGFDRAKLYFELTESIFVKDMRFITAQLNELRGKGIKIAMDDFGTGYSSLSAINRLPFDIIKIDKSFTAEITDAAMSNPLVETVINMARSLEKLVVVEGIETEAQKNYFVSKGCCTHQGYFYAKPLNIEDLKAYLVKGHIMSGRARS